MQVFHAITQATALRGSAVCLGNFDGVHRGHQALFSRARELGPPAAVTFEPHPGKVLQPELAPKLLNTLPRKLELFEQYGLHAAVVQHFDHAYAATSPEDFERALLEVLGARYIIVGSDFTYGQRRAGTIETLRNAARARGSELHVQQPVTVEGVVASSSRIREYLLEGRVEAAQRLLGRAFDLDGRVVAGQGRGKKIGVPTANVATPNEVRPGAGVYAVDTRLQGEELWRRGAANIGVKPTFGGGPLTLEVHLLNFSGDLYGRELRVRFLARLREERRFASLDELTSQIQKDLVAAGAASGG